MDDNYTAANRLSVDLDVSLLRIRAKKGRFLRNRSSFRKIIRDIAPDILITHNWGSIEWVVANKPMLVRHIHIEDGFGPQESTHQFQRRVWARRLLLRSSKVVVPSYTLKGIAQNVWHLPARSIELIPNGVDCARFAPHADAATLECLPACGAESQREGVLLIGTVAALRKEKNLNRLIRAFARIAPEFPSRLVIAGDGVERPQLKQLVRDLGIDETVVFIGHTTEAHLLYRTFDLFAMSSDTEQMPYSLLEAMASGLPVAATDVGDIREMVAQENQSYIVASEEAILAEAMRRLLADSGLRKHLGAANRNRACMLYSQDLMIDHFARLYGLPSSPQDRHQR